MYAEQLGPYSPLYFFFLHTSYPHLSPVFPKYHPDIFPFPSLVNLVEEGDHLFLYFLMMKMRGMDYEIGEEGKDVYEVGMGVVPFILVEEEGIV
jgi:hypothetical protein